MVDAPSLYRLLEEDWDADDPTGDLAEILGALRADGLLAPSPREGSTWCWVDVPDHYDDEFVAMHLLAEVFDQLDPSTRNRVLTWALDRWSPTP